MADHLDAPGLKSPFGDAKTDITDIYAFQKPGDPSKSTLILNVNPLAPTLANEFQHDAVYDMLIDTNGDAVADIGYRVTFSKKTEGRQSASVERTHRAPGEVRENDDEHEHEGERHHRLFEHVPVSFGRDAVITEGKDDAQGYRFYAGFRSDPFFFDLMAFIKGFSNGNPFTNPGHDFFADKNVFGIVLEVPNRRGLGDNPKVGYWARTMIPMGKENRLGQDDQMGRPAINTVFNHGEDKNLFNATPPNKQVALFHDKFVAALASLGGPVGLADVLLPDILTYDYSNPAGFLNGRKLADDVIDAELGLVTGGAITSDHVGAHNDYLAQFPYLGPPHV